MELAFAGQPLERLTLPRNRVAFDVVDRFRLENEETAVHPCSVAFRRIVERSDLRRVLELQGAESPARLHGRERCEPAVLLVEIDRAFDVDVAHAVYSRR